MRLWDDEIDAARPQLREESATFVASFPQGDASPGISVEDRVASQRAARIGAGEPSPRAVDRTIAGPGGPLRLRTFVPEADGTPDGVYLHFHGGGWIVGDPEMMDGLSTIIADACNVAVVSVDYRLAPEHPYPAGPDDCEAAAAWLLEHAEAEYGASKLLVGGESAGGHLSAVTLIRARDRLDAIDRFVGANLVFGVYDVSDTPSQRGVGIPPGADILTVEGSEFFTELFTPGMSVEQRRDPDLSPLYADLAGLPPALFTVGANDHLVDDTLFLASRWARAGNETELLVYPDTPHGCIGLPTVGAHWFPRLLDFLKRCLA
jgi:acetyl esterase/lipase